MRYIPLLIIVFLVPVGVLIGRIAPFWGGAISGLAMLLTLIGFYDFFQGKSAVLKNYPLVARLRFLFEHFRPEIRQYFLESDHEETPFSREQRALVYRRAKGMEGLRPFGTLRNVNEVGHEWINHSVAPQHLPDAPFTVVFGGPDCAKPYSGSVMNISGMSYGALSPNAIEALNKGAKTGGFAHTTGEGSISTFHRKHGGDLIWQIGSGYFGCRTTQGQFDPEKFAKTAADDQVKMIEIKLSQGAKPGHGGILLGAKVTKEIAAGRGVEIGVDCVSPSAHSAFSTPLELCDFIAKLREYSGGKPIGFKLCVGHPWEWFAIAKAIKESGISPDFITVDGAEGGTGAAPVEFADHKGAPLREGLMLVHNTLVGLGIRDNVKLIASGKLISAFDMCRVFALGADSCNVARGFMFALGCIQAQACHTGKCPTGVTTQDAGRFKALVVPDKAARVASFHQNTITALGEAVSSSGLSHPSQFTPHHLMIRINSREARSAASQYLWLDHGALQGNNVHHPAFAKYWDSAQPESFAGAV